MKGGEKMAEVEFVQGFEVFVSARAVRAFFLGIAWQGFQEIFFGDSLRIFYLYYDREGYLAQFSDYLILAFFNC
ncbi:MAG: hypothetical protein SXA11_15755 [Cyanobacteriota bacterium]|nr:hypothetical protein [Cyanobacteriota bacterium]